MNSIIKSLSISEILMGITIIISITAFIIPKLFTLFAFSPYKVIHNREIHRVITYGFIHADFVHLFVNMFTFYSFGRFIEILFHYNGYTEGVCTTLFLILYFGGMFFATIGDFIFHSKDQHFSAVGASGAVCAVLFSAIFYDPWNSLLLFGIIPIPAIVFGVAFILYSSFMGIRKGERVNHLAHIFGAVYGFIFPAILDPSALHRFVKSLLAPFI